MIVEYFELILGAMAAVLAPVTLFSILFGWRRMKLVLLIDALVATMGVTSLFGIAAHVEAGNFEYYAGFPHIVKGDLLLLYGTLAGYVFVAPLLIYGLAARFKRPRR